MRLIIENTPQQVAQWAADYIIRQIKAKEQVTKSPFVLGLPTGSTPLETYKELIRRHKAGEVSFRNVITFNMDEYLGLPQEHDQSYWYFMHNNFFNHLTDMKPENINILNGMTDDPEGECARLLGTGQIDAGDHRAFLRRDLHQILFLQADERLPHRRAGSHNGYPHRKQPLLRQRSGKGPRSGPVCRRRHGDGFQRGLDPHQRAQ